MQPNTEDNIKRVNITKNCTQGNNQYKNIIYPITEVCSNVSQYLFRHIESIAGDRAHSTAHFGVKSKLLLFFKHVWLAFLYAYIY